MCLNTPGSYECHCPPGTQKAARGDCIPVTEPPPPPPPPLPPHMCPINQSCCGLSQNLTKLWAELQGGGSPRRVLQSLLALLDAALAEVGGDGSAPQRHLRVTALLSATETLVRAAALRMRGHSDSDVLTSANGTELLLALPPGPPGPPLRLQHRNVGLEVPREVAGGGDNALVALLVQPALSGALGGARGVQWKKGWGGPPRTEAGGRLAFRLLTPIATAIVSDPPAGGGNVTLSFRHSDPDPRLQGRPLCAFWDPAAQLWGTAGCEGRSATPPDPPGTVCACSHLTSFVVLLAFYEPEENWALDLVTKAGLVVSVLSLVVAIVTFIVCRVPKGLRRVLHLHLSITLLLAHGTFLLGIESTHNATACAVVAGLLHFSFLAAFTWMCLEGLHLYVLLVRVFEPSWLRVWHALVSGYGLPALLVLCSAIAFPAGYGTTQYCWLSLEGGFRWSFQGPVCLIVAVNAVILTITIWKLVQKFDEVNPDMGHLRKMRVLSGTCVAQLCLLGTGWALGLPQPRGGPPPPALSFLFCAINAAQGLFILICHCLAHPQVRDAYRRCLCPASRRYTEFSTSATSATRVHSQRS